MLTNIVTVREEDIAIRSAHPLERTSDGTHRGSHDQFEAVAIFNEVLFNVLLQKIVRNFTL